MIRPDSNAVTPSWPATLQSYLLTSSVGCLHLGNLSRRRIYFRALIAEGLSSQLEGENDDSTHLFECQFGDMYLHRIRILDVHHASI